MHLPDLLCLPGASGHFPQSMELATLGGMIATRSGGHFATLYTHIDDIVQSVRVVTPSGVHESRRLPASGAGPSQERFWLGSEGTLGIITELTLRLHGQPEAMSAAICAFERPSLRHRFKK